MSTIRNNIQLIGHLGGDPEVFTTQNGKKVARVSIATNESYKNKDGELVKQTQWHKLVGWNGRAEYMEKYLRKGSFLGVSGKITNHTYQSKDGTPRTATEIRVNEFLNLTPKQQLPF